VRDQRLGQGQFGAVELAVEGRQRRGDLVLSLEKAGAHRGFRPAGDSQHHVHQLRQRDLAFVLRLGVIGEQLPQGRLIHQQLETQPRDDGAGRPFHKGSEA
jgi:hypothetical protein